MMHKQKGAVEIILVFLLVAALGLAGYFYLQSGKTPLTPLEWFVADEENLKVRTPSTPTPDPTAEWKTYESVKSWGEKYLAGLDGLTRIVVSGNGASLGGGFQTVATPEEALAEVGRAGFAKALVAGGSHVNASFAKLGLLDEIILHVNPVVLGRGIPIFAPDDFQLELAPLEASTLSEGVVRLRYRVLKK